MRRVKTLCDARAENETTTRFPLAEFIKRKSFSLRRGLTQLTALALLLSVALGAVFIQAGFAGGNKPENLTAKLAPAPTNTPKTYYVTSDTLGTPRVISDGEGNAVSRRDLLPFGEEIPVGTGGRTTAQGYGATDNIRQKFTGYERDAESGLDFAQNRYYNPLHGRFTTADEPFADQFEGNPQSWSLYSYVRNNPLNLTDPLGMAAGCPEGYPDCIEKDGKFYLLMKEGYVEISPGIENVETTAQRDGGGPNLTLAEYRQQQEERRSNFILNNILGGFGAGIGRVFKGLGRLFGRKPPTPTTTTATTTSTTTTTSLPQVGPSKVLQFGRQQLQKKFKHAKDFGVQGNYNTNTAQQFQQAVENHATSAGTQVINGTYRGQAVTHYYNSQTGINVITDRAGNFISGWKLNPAQAQNVTTRGSL